MRGSSPEGPLHWKWWTKSPELPLHACLQTCEDHQQVSRSRYEIRLHLITWMLHLMSLHKVTRRKRSSTRLELWVKLIMSESSLTPACWGPPWLIKDEVDLFCCWVEILLDIVVKWLDLARLTLTYYSCQTNDIGKTPCDYFAMGITNHGRDINVAERGLLEKLLKFNIMGGQSSILRHSWIFHMIRVTLNIPLCSVWRKIQILTHSWIDWAHRDWAVPLW